MPRLTQTGVLLSFLYLLAGTALGAWILTVRGLGWGTFAPRWLVLHMEWMVVGFMVQFPLSIAFWVLPKFGSRRGREKVAALGLGLLNAGLFLHIFQPGAVARGLEALGCGLFFLALWQRIKPPSPFMTG